MIRVRVQDGLKDVPDQLERFKRSISVHELAASMAVVITEDNVEARLAGVGSDGQPLAALAQSTVDKRKGDAAAPPLVPHGVASRAISDFEVRIDRLDEGAFEITGWWENFPALAYHIDGFTHRSGTVVPARDITGIRPQTMDRLEDMFDAWADGVAEGLSPGE